MENRKISLRTGIIALVVIIVAVISYTIFSDLESINLKINSFIRIISPFLVGIAIAFILNPLYVKIKKYIFKDKKYSTGFALLITYTIVGTLFVTLLYFLIPELILSIDRLIENLPIYSKYVNDKLIELAMYLKLDVDEAQQLINSWTVTSSSIFKQLDTLLPQALSLSRQIALYVVNALIAIITSIYLLIDKDRFIKGNKKIIIALLKEEHACKVLEILYSANTIFNGYLVGKIIDSLIIGAINFVFMTITQMPYSVLVSTIIGFTNVVPVFGPFIGAIPSILIIFTHSPSYALLFMIWILILQQFDGNILGPKILGDYTGISAIWILVAVTIGGGLFGFLGMVFAVPVFAVFYKFFNEYVNGKLLGKTDICNKNNAM